MYFFMVIIYVFTGASFIALFTTGAQGYFGFRVLAVNHPTFALATVIMYLFTEVLMMFFFVGTGASVKEYVHDKGADPIYHRRSVAIKRKLYPPTLANVLLVILLFVSGGAADTRLIPGWSHGLVFLVTVVHFARTIRTQHRCLKENTAIIWEMTKVARAEKV